MCLELKKNDQELKIAVEDITVYKALSISYTMEDFSLHGKEFIGVIKGHEVKGHICVQGDTIFFCTDTIRCSGAHCNEKFGHTYSWAMDGNVESIIVDGTERVEKILITPYQDFKVEMGQTYKSELRAHEGDVHEGFHSIVSLREAKEVFTCGYLFAECIIPAGSEYYEGTFSNVASIASDTIYYKELIS